jgi:hypothetical protein
MAEEGLLVNCISDTEEVEQKRREANEAKKVDIQQIKANMDNVFSAL